MPFLALQFVKFVKTPIKIASGWSHGQGFHKLWCTCDGMLLTMRGLGSQPFIQNCNRILRRGVLEYPGWKFEVSI